MNFSLQDLRHRELDDFLDVREVEGWKRPTSWDTAAGYVLLLTLAIVLLYVFI